MKKICASCGGTESTDEEVGTCHCVQSTHGGINIMPWKKENDVWNNYVDGKLVGFRHEEPDWNYEVMKE